jgi:hypothetical protein
MALHGPGGPAGIPTQTNRPPRDRPWDEAPTDWLAERAAAAKAELVARVAAAVRVTDRLLARILAQEIRP